MSTSPTAASVRSNSDTALIILEDTSTYTHAKASDSTSNHTVTPSLDPDSALLINNIHSPTSNNLTLHAQALTRNRLEHAARTNTTNTTVSTSSPTKTPSPSPLSTDKLASITPTKTFFTFRAQLTFGLSKSNRGVSVPDHFHSWFSASKKYLGDFSLLHMKRKRVSQYKT